jgi:hypothetical protein
MSLPSRKRQGGRTRGVKLKGFSVAFFAGGSLLALASPAFAYETRIDGEFHGWDGDTVYELTDGTVIKESNYHYHYHYAYDPEVILYNCNGFTCKIHVKGDDDDEVTVQILSGGGPQYVPTPQFVPTPVAPAPAPALQPSGSVVHAIWYMTCTGSNGSTYEVSWQSKTQSLTVRATGKTRSWRPTEATQRKSLLAPSVWSQLATGER